MRDTLDSPEILEEKTLQKTAISQKNYQVSQYFNTKSPKTTTVTLYVKFRVSNNQEFINPFTPKGSPFDE